MWHQIHWVEGLIKQQPFPILDEIGLRTQQERYAHREGKWRVRLGMLRDN
jgi:hypothetical protein